MRVDTIFPQCNAQRKWKHNSHLDKFKEMWMVVKQRRSQNSWKREFFLLFDKVSKLNIWDFIHYYSSKQLFDALTCSGGIVSCAESDVTLPLCTLFDLIVRLAACACEWIPLCPPCICFQHSTAKQCTRICFWRNRLCTDRNLIHIWSALPSLMSSVLKQNKKKVAV